MGARTLPKLTVALVVCLVLMACFEDPVREHLHLHLAPAAVVAVWTHEVEDPGVARGNAAVARRMEASREQLERGLTPATEWFALVRTAADRYTIGRVGGVVRRARWSAVLTESRELETLLARMGLTALLDADPVTGSRVLYLEPSASSRATRAERDLLDDLIADWSVAVARYLAAGAELYVHLDRRPERAVACFTHLFDEQSDDGAPALERGEAELVEALADGADDVAAALLVLDDQAYSANELSRRVSDPFPARLTVSSAGGGLDAEGMVETPDGAERPPVSLWQALVDMSGLWLEPDVVTAMVTPGPDDQQPEPDPLAFAARPRRWSSPPDAAEIQAEIRARLAAVEPVTLRWRGPGPEPDEVGDPALLLAAAEEAVPR